MKTFASTLLAAALAIAVTAPAAACPYSNKQASLTNGGSYENAQQNQSSSSKSQ